MLKLPYLALKHKLKRNAKGERERIRIVRLFETKIDKLKFNS